METLQAELASSKQEKADQKSRVSELRSVLKASVQHHKVKVISTPNNCHCVLGMFSSPLLHGLTFPFLSDTPAGLIQIKL